MKIRTKLIIIDVEIPSDAYYEAKKVAFAMAGKKVRDWMTWGTYGKSGKEPLKMVVLKNMTNEHIEAIIRTQPHIKGFYEKEFRKELQLRKMFPNLSIKETV